MRLLIIVTDCESYSFLGDYTGWDEHAPNELWTRSVGADLIAVVAQFALPSDYVGSDNDRRDEIITQTTRQLKEFANGLPQQENVTAYLAFHDGCVDVASLRSEIKISLKGVAPFKHLRDFSEEFVYPALCALVNSPTSNTFDAAIEVVMARQGRTRAERVYSLRYRLLRLFVPIELDLAVWQESNFDEQYLKELRAAYANADRRLTQARKLLYGGEPPAESLEDIISKGGLTEHPAWRAAQTLLPRTTPASTGDQSANNLFDQVFGRDNLLVILQDSRKMAQLKEGMDVLAALRKWSGALAETLVQLADELRVRETKAT